ncbi:MAG: presqualene diphosphate synthase HpnD [Stellaceae bacterium]
MTAVADPSPGALKAQIRGKVQAAGSSFYWAMRLLPPERRDAMFAVYAYCREVDDIADSNDAPDVKQAGLATWRAEVTAVYEGKPKTPLGKVLAEIVGRYNLRQADFLDIIDGMQMDAERDIRAPSMADLDLYCDRVASAVGRLSVHIFGDDRPAAIEVAHHLGRALQLTNILRDVAEDGERGRLYLPKDLLKAHGIHATVPTAVLRDPVLGRVCEDLAKIADQHFDDAAIAMRQCSRRAMRPAAVMRAVYQELLRRLRAAGWRDLATPVKVPSGVKLLLALRYGLL